MRFLNDLNYL